ncbi:uncharacterized protein HMPREF1541_08431 [Cyphellophora europaea CBS 101466]|uniref:Uncharacterized protein n=1 Tax=Cyphellophora europaea (strain CBS 101466) TaxID=1220924 RepID=W2RMB5_CYPE1|nr:uncharacterized protein HMPREF1541_08431 [Cyphellophora europaea CBS 101466]ETN37440.1 hypothetical protein HMPREF1541_08431 [Cyphellophora europaea CBS 101466]
MSAKAAEANEDQIPSYEESIASAPAPQYTGSSQKTTSTPFQQRIREQRQRRIASILLNNVEPAISQHLEDASNDMTLILVAPDAFPNTSPVATSSIMSPSVTKPTTLIRLAGDDLRTAFLTSWQVVQDLSDTLIRSMVDPSTIPQLQAQLPEVSSETAAASLPERPPPKSWFKRTFGMPPADHDPTGQTGKWNLGWRSEENPAMMARTITTNEVVITAKLVDVSFRIESALGLLESTTVKSLWLDVLVRA